MNRLRSILFAFCGLSICVCSNAQDAIEGPNLNIGSGNTLNGNHGRLWLLASKRRRDLCLHQRRLEALRTTFFRFS